MAHLVIRAAGLSDVPSILDLERLCPTAAHWTETQYRTAISSTGGSGQRLVLLAVNVEHNEQTAPDRGMILGFLVARHVPPEWELENIAVAASARRTGVGKMLLDELLAAASRTNSERVFLEVRESNVPARTFYEKSGFEPTGRRRSYYASPIEDSVLYCKVLN